MLERVESRSWTPGRAACFTPPCQWGGSGALSARTPSLRLYWSLPPGPEALRVAAAPGRRGRRGPGTGTQLPVQSLWHWQLPLASSRAPLTLTGSLLSGLAAPGLRRGSIVAVRSHGGHIQVSVREPRLKVSLRARLGRPPRSAKAHAGFHSRASTPHCRGPGRTGGPSKHLTRTRT